MQVDRPCLDFYRAETMDPMFSLETANEIVRRMSPKMSALKRAAKAGAALVIAADASAMARFRYHGHAGLAA
ncbi:hypothetical protein C3Y91_24660 [Rhizobium sp. UPM1133]|nr:hypothetical protein [Rhizobium ruizarguesonis]